jgi:DNA uptake protein ComE-like DNA-binding protein
MKIRYLLVIAAGFMFCSHTAAQSDDHSLSSVKEVLMEPMVAAGYEPAEMENVLHDLDDLQQHPLDLNKAGKEEFKKLPFLTDFQINSLIQYRQEHGPLLSVYELQVIYGFTPEVINLIIPFVTVVEKPFAEGRRSAGGIAHPSHDITIRAHRLLEKAEGYEKFDSVSGSMHYPGNPWMLGLRYGMESGNHLRAGFTAEKDPGETAFSGSNRAGFDFNSAYLLVENVGCIKTLAAGDYRLAFGQGLVLSGGASPGKSSMPLSIAMRQDVIRPFTAADENNFFRGIAGSIKTGKFVFSGFWSAKHRDANITDTLSPDRICFSSFQESGCHRTRSEIADERSVKETAYGANVVYRNNYLKLGTTLVEYAFDKYLEAGNEPREVHDFHGNNLVNWGIDYALTLKKIQFFGETALGNQGWAMLNGIILNVNSFASFSMLYRYYAPDYFGLHASAFTEGSKVSDEEGFYTGFVLHPAAKWMVSGYAEFFRFPWLRYQVSAPAWGMDDLLQVDHTPSRQVAMILRIKYKLDPDDELSDSALIPEVASLRHLNLRYNIRYKLSNRLIMQNRLEITRVTKESTESSGMLLFHDISYSIKNLPLQIDCRLAWFKTEDYASRIYAYEDDMTAGFAFSPLYNQGLRYYILCRYAITPKVKFSLRFSQTNYSGTSSLGTGNDLIQGHTRSEIKLQLMANL